MYNRSRYPGAQTHIEMANIIKVRDEFGSPYAVNMDHIEAMYEEPEFAGSEYRAFEDAHPARTLLHPVHGAENPYLCLESIDEILEMLK